MNKFILVALLLAATSVQAGSKDNMLNVSHHGAEFKGKAGPGWTNEDLQNNAFGALCPKGTRVTNLQITRNKKGVGKFTGTCAK
ncbi:hypothetical protein [Cognatishimia activa]|uniref:hypothetical protein n=1 Tax=Cognatishimia activa TaxID=1715691 RepID=UPI00222EEDDB|nr:hypothetical protein [Cognatishimia activa]UZD91159.1 hypothetical protein M0D42_00675 [Cognatishimia activa]